MIISDEKVVDDGVGASDKYFDGVLSVIGKVPAGTSKVTPLALFLYILSWPTINDPLGLSLYILSWPTISDPPGPFPIYIALSHLYIIPSSYVVFAVASKVLRLLRLGRPTGITTTSATPLTLSTEETSALFAAQPSNMAVQQVRVP